MARPKVSVVIPVYNTAPYLVQCMDSIVEQTLTDIEIICINDGSTDGSGDILDEYARKDKRIQVVHQNNIGAGLSRNVGISLTQGEYLSLLDADDIFEKDMLEQMVKNADHTHSDIVICRSVSFDSDSGKEMPSEWMLKLSLLKEKKIFVPTEIADVCFQFTYGWAWDKLFRMNFIKKSGLTFPDLRHSEDLVFVFPALTMADRISIEDQILIQHRMNRKQSVSNSVVKAPNAPWEALTFFGDLLRKSGKYEIFKRSFLLWAMDFFIWHSVNLVKTKGQDAYIKKIKKVMMPLMGFEKYRRSYYWDKEVYVKYILLRYLPVPAFKSIVRLYYRVKAE